MSAYSTLGLPEGASRDDAKRAYRRLALQYHPDRNPSAEAHHKFIEISEAYEEIVEGKSKKAPFIPYDFYQPTNSRPRPTTVEERQRMREERAREFAKQELEEYLAGVDAFRKSPFYPLMIVFFHFIRLFFFAVAALLLYLTFLAFTATMIGGLVMVIIALPVAYILVMAGQSTFIRFEPYFRDNSRLNLNDAHLSQNRLAKIAYKIPGLDFSHSRLQKVLIFIPAIVYFLLIADYFLPHSSSREYIVQNDDPETLTTDNFAFQVRYEDPKLPGNEITVRSTPIFHIVKDYSSPAEPEVFYLPRQTVYTSLWLMLPIMVVLCWIGWATGSRTEADAITVVNYGLLLLMVLFFM